MARAFPDYSDAYPSAIEYFLHSSDLKRSQTVPVVFQQFFNASRFEALDVNLELSESDFVGVEVRRSTPNPAIKVMLFQWP